MEDILIDLGVSQVLRMLKSKKDASKWRRAMLKIFRAIGEAYKNDQEFSAAASEVAK